MAHFASPQNTHISAASPTGRSWARRVVIGLNIVLGTVLVASLVGLGYALFVYGQLDRLSLGLGSRGVSQPMNILLVGSDSRDGLTKAEKKIYGPEIGQRSDTIMLAHLDPAKKSVTMVSFPRDLWVNIAGTSGKQRINSAYSTPKTSSTGAKRLIDTIQQDFDLKIDHYVEVNFSGFKSIVDSIGGMHLYFEGPTRDLKAGFSVREAGCRYMTGTDALAYSRSRDYQWKANGYWHTDPQSDISRIQRQQNFVKDVVARTLTQTNNSALTTERLIRNGIDYVKVDDGFGVSDLVSIAKKYKGVDPNTMQLLGSIPAKGASIGGAAVLIPDYEGASVMLAPFREGGGSAPSKLKTSSSGPGSVLQTFKPSEVTIRVLNGSGVDDQASDTATALKSYGFATISSAAADTYAYTKTVVRYAPGELAKAKFVQSFLKGDSVLQQKDLSGGVDIELVTGSSYAGLVTTTSSTTSTTVRSTTTTAGVSPTTGSPSGTPAAAAHRTTSGAPIPYPCKPK